VLYRHFLVECLTELGEFDEAAAISDEAVRASEALDNPWSRALAYFAMAMVAVQRGDPLRAVAVAAQGLDLCDTYDMTFLWPRLASLNGYAMALSGQYEHGVALMERALQASLAMRLGQEETLRRAYASEGYLLAGRIHEARDTALGALEFAKQHNSTDSARELIEIWETSRDFIPRFCETAPSTTTARPCAGPTSGACAPSLPTAIWGSVGSIAAMGTAGRLRSTSPSRRRCIEKWT
jgi:tetratricopeptide (TPR) repeat protein